MRSIRRIIVWKHRNMLAFYLNDSYVVLIDNLTFNIQGYQLVRTNDTGTDSTISDSMDFKDGENTGNVTLTTEMAI